MKCHNSSLIDFKCLSGLWKSRIFLPAIPLLLSQSILAASLNDTGQQLCYDGSAMVACTAANTGDAATYRRQDGRFGRDAAATAGTLAKTGAGAAGFDFTALDATTGAEVATSSGATPHGCVRDNVTGLTWEVKTDNGGLRDKDWTYTWYSIDNTTNGGNAGSVGTNTCGGTLSTYANQCNTTNYITAVKATNLCGYNDWRLPTIRELQTIVHYYDVNSLSIDTTYFPNTLASYVWSASSSARLPANAWYVSFYDGAVYANDKTNGSNVRLVRGGQF